MAIEHRKHKHKTLTNTEKVHKHVSWQCGSMQTGQMDRQTQYHYIDLV